MAFGRSRPGTTTARVRCVAGAPRAPLRARHPTRDRAIDHASSSSKSSSTARRRRIVAVSALAADAADAAADAADDADADDRSIAARRRRIAGAALATADADAAEAEAAISNLLGWVQANGVDTSRVGVFVEPSGERGIVAAQSTRKGEALLVVPLRLAIADYAAAAAASAPDDQSPCYPGAPWSVRLASRLLREAGAGARSPWSAYVRALPLRVPAAASWWGWDATRRLRDARAEAALHSAAFLADDAFERLLPRAAEAWGPELAAQAAAAGDPAAYLRERWDWALSCVHSRTFLVGTRDGAGARAMLPLLDLCNHAGDETRRGGTPVTKCSLGRAAAEGTRARDNVRWDAERRARPGGGGGEEWALVLTALRPLIAGEELLLSYGERENDDFLCHYGFLPALNPHDDVALFSSAAGARGALEEAAEWHWAVRGAAATAGDEEAATRYGAAVDKALAAEEQRQSGAESAAQTFALRVAAGSRVSPGLVALFAELEGGDARRAELLVARRCWQLLLERDCSLLADLAALALDETERRRRRRQESGGSQENEQEEDEAPFASWFLPHYYRSLVVEKGLCLPDGEWRRRTTTLAEEAAAAAAPAGDSEADDDPEALARRLLRPSAAAAGGGDSFLLGDEEIMALTFRAYKGMILVDCVVDSGSSFGDLVE